MSHPPPPPKNWPKDKWWFFWDGVALVLAVALLIVAIRIGLDDKESTAPVPITEAVVTQTVDPNEDAYVLAIRQQTGLYSIQFDDLVALGRAICADLDAGKTPAEAGTQIYQAFPQITPSDAGVILGRAIRHFCPQHEDTPFN